MNMTTIALMTQFNTAMIPLSDMCEEYLGCKPRTANAKAAANTLELTPIRLGSRKSPLVVPVWLLAELIDKRIEEAKKNHIGAK